MLRIPLSLWLALAFVTSAPCAAQQITLDEGNLLTYRGKLAAVKGDPNESLKTFELQLLVGSKTDNNRAVYWALSENLRGSWPWIDQIGQLQAGVLGQVTGGRQPTLFYDRGDGTSTVGLLFPILKRGTAWKEGQIWTEGRLNYRVGELARAAGRDAWQVSVRSPIGPKRSLSVDAESSLIVSMTETVFIGPGRKHRLQMDLVKSRQLNEAQFQQSRESFTLLLKLRKQLGRTESRAKADWDAKQMTLINEQLTAAARLASDGPLEGIVRAARNDTRFQQSRSTSIKDLKAGLVGREVPRFTLAANRGEGISEADLAGSVTVLHFWGYRDTPLIEPYGQAGYLDFLFRRYKKAGLKVYGVSVDERLATAETRQKALRSSRKFSGFMNLSYRLLWDDGKVLTLFGDPQRLGAKLPLFVVIGADGKVLHYHVGAYEVDRNVGLLELDTLVKRALDNRG